VALSSQPGHGARGQEGLIIRMSMKEDATQSHQRRLPWG
jgi:hypothetical protein